MILRRILIAACCLVVLAGCSNPMDPTSTSKDDADTKKQSSTSDVKAESKLVLNGEVVNPSGTEPEDPEEPEPQLAANRTPPPNDTNVRKKTAGSFVTAKPLKPTLYDDGTLFDGADPFLDDHAVAMPVPIERNPEVTKDIDLFAKSLRGVEGEQWQRWINDRSPTARAGGPADILGSMVKIWTERCGGAKAYASGVVADDEIVVTTVTAIESPQRRIRVSPLTSQGERLAATIKYLDVDDDIAVLYVPGLLQEPMLTNANVEQEDGGPQRALAIGAATGGTNGSYQRVPVYVGMQEDDLRVGQRDGLSKKISNRGVYPIAGAIDTGMTGGAVVTSLDPDLVDTWGWRGMIRARVPYRSTGGGVAIPVFEIGKALRAAEKLPEWHEFQPQNCPQWYRPYRGATTIR